MSLSKFNFFIKYKWNILACVVLILYLFPYFTLGGDTHIRVHDNLDSNIVWYKLLAETGQLFAGPGASIPNVINGLPRSALPSPFDAVTWLYVWFEPFTAYTISQTIMRFAAFFGMYLLLSRFVIRDFRGSWLTAGCSLAFAMLPFWPSGVLTIAGLPLAFYLFFTIRQQEKRTPWYIWLAIGFIPLLSNFILTFIFFLGLMGVLWLIEWVGKKRFNMPFFIAIVGMTAIYLLKNYMLLYTMFIDSTFTSHRKENELGHKDLQGTLDLFVHNFLNGHTHDMAVHTSIVLPVLIFGVFIAIVRGGYPTRLVLLFAATPVLSMWYALWYWEGLRPLKDSLNLLNTFNFARIHFFDPVIWYVCFALALVILVKQVKAGWLISAALLIAQCWNVFQLNEENKYSEINTPTFNEFYSTELFDEIKEYIGEDPSTYRVISVAMHPTIAQYNGFYTLDTYNNTYPLEYKHQFRDVIADELEKSPALENYFDTWGGRAYTYSSELGKHYMFKKTSDRSIEELSLNTEALKELGGQYVFSALPIENDEQINLHHEQTFENEASPWRIYLYQVQ
ncbi:putative membrane protein YkoS [Halobacillus andaensis]|uniref:Membrane protein YkoS n=1 Tax=Halobacillus andaensis TaxID=1176239 RepID=A0A917EX51_HALAA|nr:DUF6044 family protein [Halobacillus andaensis]MBP2005202.1 hypothetical protein [Halobacillus andaensis]GGF29631.1 putative membrane protein YkoS [Halobacillus andaensis]